ncbi:MAG TPA: hypothetical protein VFS39_01460 [Nitrospira sp.]|nr:hypothetical protein [Nitrospira sp.]
MRPRSIALVAAVLLTTSVPAWSETPEKAEFDPMKMWSCPQPDGTILYTNKDIEGCTLMTLKPLSVVPSLDNMPTYRPPVVGTPPYDVPAYPDRHPAALTGRPGMPDWAREWYASIGLSGGSVQAEVCGMYSEWLHLNLKTRGGFFFGNDPSYGGDVSDRNRRGPSFSFNDNVRYHALTRIFGTGFVPVGCQ